MQLAVAFGASGLFSGAGLMKVGFLAASAFGSMAMGHKKEENKTKLNDLKVSCSSYGKGLPIIWGTMRCSGNMIWSTDFEEVKKVIGKKGKEKSGKMASKKVGKGKAQEVYLYYANFAMSLCEGPISELLRVWADSNLIYDKYNPNGYKDENGVKHKVVSPGFSQGDGQGAGGKTGGQKGKGSNGGDSGRFSYRLYTGSEFQKQDPFMVKKQGITNVPAFRGQCYLFFQKFALQDFGNRIPTINAEVSVKKTAQLSFAAFINLDHNIRWDNGWEPYGDIHVMDPVRYRMYVMFRHSSNNRVMVRVYDFSTMKEIKRKYLDDISSDIPFLHPFAGLDPTQDPYPIKLGRLLGCDNRGNLIFADDRFANSTPAYFVDPNSFQVIEKYGAFGNEVGQTTINLPVVQRATMVPVFDDGGIGGEPKMEYLTVINGAFGQIAALASGTVAGLKGLWAIGDADVGRMGRGCGGTPNKALTGTYYFIDHNSTGDRIMSCSLTQLAGIPIDGTIGGGGSNLNLPFETVYQTNRNSQDVAVLLGDPFIVIGAECLGVIEAVISNNADRNGVWVIKLNVDGDDVSTGWRYRLSPTYTGGRATPDQNNNHFQQTVMLSGNLMSWRGDNNTVWTIDFQNETAKSYKIPADLPQMYNDDQFYWPPRGGILNLIRAPASSPALEGTEFVTNEYIYCFALVDRLAQVPAGIRDICIDLAQRVGIPASRVDVSQLNDETIMGFMMEQPTSARQMIDDLAKVFFFDVIESDYSLKFISRGRQSDGIIRQKDLGKIDDGGDTEGDGHEKQETMDYYKETRNQEIDLPKTVVVSYVNPNLQYQTNSQHYTRPSAPLPVMHTKEHIELNLPMALLKDKAKQLAQKACLSMWAERVSHDLVLPWTYAFYDPSDVVTFIMDDGLTFEDRILKADFGADYSIEVGSCSQVYASYTSDAIAGSPGGVIITRVDGIPPQVQAYVADVPLLSDGDDEGFASFPYYWGAMAYGSGFRFATLRARGATGDYQPVDTTDTETPWGTIIGRVPPPPHGPFATDDTTVLKIAQGREFTEDDGEYEWESTPDDEWPSGFNCLIVEDEVIYFKDVNVRDDGLIELSTLMRGMRGTEDAAYRHTSAAPNFIIVKDDVLSVTVPASAAGSYFAWQCTSPMVFAQFAPTTSHVLTAAPLKPYAPNYVQRVDNGADIQFTWYRRTRLSGEWKDGTGTVPLAEESEIYEFYVLDAPYDPTTFVASDPDTYIRAWVDLTVPFAPYSAAQLSSDGLTVNSPIHVVVFQCSPYIGRGFPGAQTTYRTVLT
jgi:hypothetical protein